MNTLKKINHARTARRLRRRPVLFKFPPEQRLTSAGKRKPKQPTIVKLSTAKRLAYLERHGLADFSDTTMVVEHTHYHDKVLNKLIRLPQGTQCVGV